MSCNCIDTMDALLGEHNTRLVVTFGFPRDGRPAYTWPKIQTEKVETRKRVGPVLMIPTFCPFCGERYEPAPAAPAAQQEAV